MISFWVDPAGTFTIEGYLARRGEALRDRFRIVPYDWATSRVEAAPGPHIFGALDQLGATGRAIVSSLYDQIVAASPQRPPLNDPRRCLLRPELLRALAREGVNSFRVYAPDEIERIDRFPLFIRESHQHHGSLTPLLHNRAALRRALRALAMRGYRRVDLLIVEFCDTSGRDGVFRKYSAFRVGDAVVATHLLRSADWSVKSENDARTIDAAREGLEYAETNPYRDWIDQVFTIAGIDYGRIDFGVKDGIPQAWEINLNPTVGRGPGSPTRPIAPDVAEILNQAREHFHSKLRDAFAALDQGTLQGQGSVVLTIDPELLRKAASERNKTTTGEKALAAARKAYHHRVLGAPFRLLGNWLFSIR